MLERKTVSEVIAALCVAVPVDRGGELVAGTQEVLESLPIVRYADVREIGEVDVGDDELAVTTDSRLTLHVGDATESVTAACEDLRELDRVLGVDRFETVDGPCRMKRW